MIRDRIQNFIRTTNTFQPGTSPSTPTSLEQGHLATPSPVQLSTEAAQPQTDDARIGNLLGGLGSWGSPEPVQSSGRNAAPRTASGGWDQVLKSGQMPMAIINQVFNTMKTAGGMATAGALHSLLSWGATERQKTGQIRPEFQEILHEAIEIAKQNKNMSEEDLKKYEDKLFGDDKACRSDHAEAGKSGKGGDQHAPSIADQIHKKMAAHGHKKSA